MLDHKLFRQSLDEVSKKLLKRGFVFNTELYLSLENERKGLQEAVQQLQAKRNASSKEIGAAKKSGQDVAEIMRKISGLSDELKEKNEKLEKNLKAIHELLSNVPNIPIDDIPTGKDEKDNVELKKVGEPTVFNFEVKDHVALGEP